MTPTKATLNKSLKRETRFGAVGYKCYRLHPQPLEFLE
jgi:hypothetical protein